MKIFSVLKTAKVTYQIGMYLKFGIINYKQLYKHTDSLSLIKTKRVCVF